MKRKAFDAGLPWELSPGYVFRMRIEICDRLTGYEPVTVDVQLSCGDIVDTAKYLVSLRLYEQFGRFPKLSTFQLVQNGRHLSFTAPVTTADTLSITKPWNKYYGKDAWGAGQTDRDDVKEATPAEITAANKRKSEGKSDVQGAEKTDPAADPDDEEYLRTLWTSAKEAAHGDPSRPKSAAELVAAGELRPWWTYSWKQVSEMFPQTSDYKECLQSACGDIPPLVVRFDIPGQHVVAATCHMPFPEYQESSEYAHFGTFSHGTSWTAGAGIAEKGGLTVGHSQADHFPCFGFSARGSLTAFSRESMISAVTKTATRSKSLGGIIVVTEATLPGPTPNIEGGGEYMHATCRDSGVTEATLPGPTPNIEGGGEYMHATCRDSGSVRSGDHFLISPRYAVLKGIAVSWPK
eukprot:s11383_g1.t1